MNDLIYIGFITGFHGIKGELKVKSDFELKNRCFIKYFNIYIDNNIHKISSHRTHKQFDLITIDDLDDLNEVNKYIGKDVFIKRDDLNLGEDEYLYNDLIDCEIIDDGILIGKVIDLRKTNILILEVMDKKKYFIPFVKEYIKKVDIKEKKIYTMHAKELIL